MCVLRASQFSIQFGVADKLLLLFSYFTSGGGFSQHSHLHRLPDFGIFSPNELHCYWDSAKLWAASHGIEPVPQVLAKGLFLFLHWCWLSTLLQVAATHFLHWIALQGDGRCCETFQTSWLRFSWMGAEECELLLFQSALLQVIACHCSLTLRSRRETQQERGKSLIAWSHTPLC